MKLFLFFFALFIATALAAPINTAPYQYGQTGVPQLQYSDVWPVQQDTMRSPYYPAPIINREQQFAGVPYTPAYILERSVEQVAPISQYYEDLPVQTPYMPITARDMLRQRMVQQPTMMSDNFFPTENKLSLSVEQQRILERLSPIEQVQFLKTLQHIQQLQQQQLGFSDVEQVPINMENPYVKYESIARSQPTSQFQTLDADMDVDVDYVQQLLHSNVPQDMMKWTTDIDTPEEFEVNQWRGGRGGWGRGGWGGGYGGYGGWGIPGYGGYGYGYPGYGYGGYGGYGYPGYGGYGGYGGWGGWGRGGGRRRGI